MNWSAYQNEIFNQIQNGTDNLVINAVAGSGKTTTIVHGASLLRPGQRVVFLAFNKHVVETLKGKLPNSVDCMTIHSLGMKACGRGFSGKLKVDSYKYSDIVDETTTLEQSVPGGMHGVFAKLVKQIVNIGRLTVTDFRSRDAIDDMIAHFDMAADMGETADRMGVSLDWLLDMAVDVSRRCLRMGLEAYDARGVIDFTDMLYLPVIRNLPILTYDVVMVDEAQDLSKSQLEIVLRAAARGRVVAVGDASQAIQGFAGADNESFAKIAERTNAVKLPLSVCYRCPSSHVALAQEIVPSIEVAPGAIAGTIETITPERFSSMPHRGDLIVCRVNAPLIGAALRLIAKGIQARIRGGNIGKMLGKMAADADLIAIDENVANKGWRVAFSARLERLVSMRVQTLSTRRHTESAIEALNDQAECLRVYIDGNPSISSTIELTEGVDALFADEGATVWLSSVHRAKGLEAERVFILRPDKLELKWKNQMAWQAEQESNLHYVAVTRAKSVLYFVEEPQAGASSESATLNVRAAGPLSEFDVEMALPFIFTERA